MDSCKRSDKSKTNISELGSSSHNDIAIETNITGQLSSAFDVQVTLPRDTSHGRTERGVTTLVGDDERSSSSARGTATADENNPNVDTTDMDIPNDKNWDLKVLVKPTDTGKEHLIDIVAVHGIGADSGDTWVHKTTKVDWLEHKDMLPKQAPNARIMRFGYNAKWFGSSDEQHTKTFVRNVSERLLKLLEMLRKDSARPLIFIAHSYGGLPVIHALCRSRYTSHEWGNSFQFTAGLVFFGVPFRGRDGPPIEQWIEKIEEYHMQDSTFQIWSETMSASVPGSQYLGEIVSRYLDTRVCDHPIPISCFCELFPSPVGRFWGEKDPEKLHHYLVSESSACIDPSKGVSRASLQRHHYNLQKFEGPNDPDWAIVAGCISVLAQDARSFLERGARVVNFKQKENVSFQEPVGILCGEAPYIASELFVGRDDELAEITRILRPDHKAQKQRRLVLGGMGGIGKTHLAIAYVESDRGSYDSVFWLNAASEAALNGSFRSIAHQIFAVEEHGVLEDKEIVRRIHQWLGSPKNTGWLLIFDNYDDPNQFRIDHYYPYASHGAILVTTRRPDLVAGRTLDIKGLKNIKDSLKILQTRSKRDDVQSDPYATYLSNRLGGLPLALATAGTYLRQGHSTFTFERYLEEYNTRWNVDPRRPAKLLEYKGTFYTTWDMSYSRLEKEDPDAAKLLKLLAYFDNQRLWYELLHAGLTDGSPKWLKRVITDDVDFHGAMRILADYCFLDVHKGSWSMHNCVHDWTLATLNKDINANLYWYAFDCVSASINVNSAHDLANLSYSPLAAHATRLVQPRLCQNDVIYDVMPRRLDQALLIADLLREQVLLLASEKMYQRALAGSEKELGPDHISTLDTVHNLGILYQKQGKQEQAETMYQRALAGKEKALGIDHISTLDTVQSLGVLYRKQGKLEQAEIMYQRALAGKEKALGLDHISTLDAVHSLGILYRKQGKQEQAETMYQRALARKEKALGLDHISTLDTVHSLGVLYRKQGKLEQAETMYQRALAGKEKALRLDHISTLKTVHSLRVLYRKQGKLEQAETMYQRALAREKKKNTDTCFL